MTISIRFQSDSWHGLSSAASARPKSARLRDENVSRIYVAFICVLRMSCEYPNASCLCTAIHADALNLIANCRNASGFVEGVLMSLQPKFWLTGVRRKRRYLVRVAGHDVWLTSGNYSALASLVYARTVGERGGTASVTTLDAFRLRREIAGVCDDKETIICCGQDRYLLDVDPVQHVWFDPSFFELESEGLFAQDVITTLSNSKPTITHLDEIGLK